MHLFSPLEHRRSFSTLAACGLSLCEFGEVEFDEALEWGRASVSDAGDGDSLVQESSELDESRAVHETSESARNPEICNSVS